ncbi:MAG TPA: autotransporter-associated beta strand repeat-containing protein, partial [Verrucomicrobiae bacterium]|nr:autotransporter-associated beta strand repeat-containing protein [Verrucomicrobiae bacterium]
GGIVVTNGTLTLAQSGAISGGLTLNPNGGSPVALVTGAGTLNGGITNSGGSLVVSNAPVINGGLTANSGNTLLDETTTPTGSTVIAGGVTVNVGNNDGAGNLPLGAVTNNGVIAFNRIDSFTNADFIAGTGTITVNNGGTATLSGNTNTYTGNTTVNSGTLRPTGTNALGVGIVTINPAGTLVENVNDAISNSVTLVGGTLGVSSANNFTFGTNAVLTLSANTTNLLMSADPQNPATSRNLYVAGVLGGSGIGIVMNATNVTATDGSQAVRFVGTNGITSSFSGTIVVTNNAKCELATASAGPFSPIGTGSLILCAGEYDGNNTLNCTNVGGYLEFNLRNTTGSTTMSNNYQIAGSGAVVFNSLGTGNGAVVTLGNLNIGSGQELIGYRSAGGTTNTAYFPTVMLTGGNATFSPHSTTFGATNQAGMDFQLGNVSQTSASGIIMAGAGNLTLSGINTYTGNTTVNAGTLWLTGNSLLTNSPMITVASGATLDVTGRANQTLTLLGGQTLTDNGNFNGNITNNSSATIYGNGSINNGTLYYNGGVVAPGNGTGGIGTLTINGTVDMSLGGTTYMELNKTNGVATNDVLAVNGVLGYGGTLTVTNLGPALVGGDSFQLFAVSVSHYLTFTATNLPPLSAGLSWSNTLASNGKITVVGTSVVKLPPHIVSFSRSGTNLIFMGTNGVAGNPYVLWTSTNVALPLASWTQVLTGNFDGSGNFNFTNGVTPGSPRQFYIISQ